MSTANMRSSIVCFLFFACSTSAYPRTQSDGGIVSIPVEDTPTAELDSEARKEFYSLSEDESLSWNEMKEKLRQWAENVNKVEEMENYLIKEEKRKEAWIEGLKNAVDMLEEKVSTILEIITNEDFSEAKMTNELENITLEPPVKFVIQQFTQTKRNTRSVDDEFQDDHKEKSATKARRLRRSCGARGSFCRWPGLSGDMCCSGQCLASGRAGVCG